MTNGNAKLIFKESRMTTITEDAGFCSGEDYIESEIHSPTDSSEDSLEVKVSVISLGKGKRKRPEPEFTGPLKKRMCLKVKAEAAAPFRPWNKSPASFAVPFPVKAEPTSPVRNFAYFRPPSPITVAQDEPVALVVKREREDAEPRVPVHPQIAKLSAVETERMILKTNEQFPPLVVTTPQKKAEQKREQRNYKNMTRERRIEANARERTRVHTISAAFDTLRRAVPSYSHNQKLSKLSVLRIACSYIMTLSSLVSGDGSEPNTSDCVDLVSRTIQREGKLRKKKDDND